MKTVRQSTFETNSSSTHSISLKLGKADAKYTRDVVFAPGQDAIIIHVDEWGPCASENTLNSKLGFIVECLIFLDSPLKDEFIKQAEAYGGRKIEVSTPEGWSPNDWANMSEEEANDAWRDAFCEYEKADWQDFNKFRSNLETLLSDVEKMLDFVFCSAIGFSTYEYFDG